MAVTTTEEKVADLDARIAMMEKAHKETMYEIALLYIELEEITRGKNKDT